MRMLPQIQTRMYISIYVCFRERREGGGISHVSKIKENANIFYDYPKAHKVNS